MQITKHKRIHIVQRLSVIASLAIVLSLAAAWMIHAFSFAGVVTFSQSNDTSFRIHLWEKQEVNLTASKKYENPYTDVTVWIDLRGPAFEKRVYGFWNGGNIQLTSSGEIRL